MDNGIIKRRRSYDYLEEKITAEDVIEAFEEKLNDEERLKVMQYIQNRYFDSNN